MFRNNLKTINLTYYKLNRRLQNTKKQISIAANLKCMTLTFTQIIKISKLIEILLLQENFKYSLEEFIV